jgi:hypothetical protein
VSLHNFQHQVGITLGNIGQQIKSRAEVAGAAKGIVDTYWHMLLLLPLLWYDKYWFY